MIAPQADAPKRAFIGNVARLCSGQAVAVALPILAAPLLGRLYTPADYGALALFMASTGMLSVVATLQLHHGIIAARSLPSARILVWLSVWMAGILALGLLGILSVAALVGTSLGWFWLLPLSVAIAGLMAGTTTLANRTSLYGALAGLQATAVGTTVAGSLLFGLWGWGQAGLFAGYAMGQLVNLGYGLHLWGDLMTGYRPSLRRLTANGLRNRRFAIYTLPSEFLGNWNQHLPVFALATIGAGPYLGAFSRARRLASLPVTLLGSSAGQVFRAEAAALWRESGTCRTLYLRTAAGLFLIGLGPCLVLVLAAPPLVTLYLGPDWTEAGQIAQVLAPMLLLRLAVSPVTAVFQITGNQRIAFYLSLVATIVIGIGVVGPVLWGAPPQDVIVGFTISYAAIYVLHFIVGLRVSSR